MGFQIPLLAPATGMFVGNPEVPFETNISAGTIIGEIYDLYGDVVGQVKAPRDGVIFGLRSRPSVLEGQWCCFFGVIEQTVDNLIPGTR
jgi:predicted deacylase